MIPTTTMDLHEGKKIKPLFLISFFLEVVCFSCTVKCLLQGHYISAEQEKSLLWRDGGTLLRWGEISSS